MVGATLQLLETSLSAAFGTRIFRRSIVLAWCSWLADATGGSVAASLSLLGRESISEVSVATTIQDTVLAEKGTPAAGERVVDSPDELAAASVIRLGGAFEETAADTARVGASPLCAREAALTLSNGARKDAFLFHPRTNFAIARSQPQAPAAASLAHQDRHLR